MSKQVPEKKMPENQAHIKRAAESWADAHGPRDSVPWVTAHDSYLIGWSIGTAQAVAALKRQFDGFKGKVSYAIAAEVLRTDLKNYETRGWEK